MKIGYKKLVFKKRSNIEGGGMFAEQDGYLVSMVFTNEGKETALLLDGERFVVKGFVLSGNEKTLFDAREKIKRGKESEYSILSKKNVEELLNKDFYF